MKVELDDALRQIDAAKLTDTPIEWHIATEEKAILLREIFRENRITGITVVWPPKFLSH